MPISERVLKELRTGKPESLTPADCAEIVAELDATGEELEKLRGDVVTFLKVEVAEVVYRINSALQTVSSSVAAEVNVRATANQKIAQTAIDLGTKFNVLLASIPKKS